MAGSNSASGVAPGLAHDIKTAGSQKEKIKLLKRLALPMGPEGLYEEDEIESYLPVSRGPSGSAPQTTANLRAMQEFNPNSKLIAAILKIVATRRAEMGF